MPPRCLLSPRRTSAGGARCAASPRPRSLRSGGSAPAPNDSTGPSRPRSARAATRWTSRSEEHTSELQSRPHLVCRLLLEKKKNMSAYHYWLSGVAWLAEASPSRSLPRGPQLDGVTTVGGSAMLVVAPTTATRQR